MGRKSTEMSSIYFFKESNSEVNSDPVSGSELQDQPSQTSVSAAPLHKQSVYPSVIFFFFLIFTWISDRKKALTNKDIAPGTVQCNQC